MKTKLELGIEFEPVHGYVRMHKGLFGEYPVPAAGLVDLTLLANPAFVPESKHWQAIAVPTGLGITFECLALDELHAVGQIRQWLDEHNLCTAGIGGLHVSSEHSVLGWLKQIAEIPLCSEVPGIAGKDTEDEAKRIMLARTMVKQISNY